MNRVKEIIDQAVKNFVERKLREREINVMYPSELFFCMRRNYYLYKNPKPFDEKILKIFESSMMVHNWVRNVLLKAYQDKLIDEFKDEERVSWREGEVEIRGRFDDMIYFRLENEPILIEVKTVRNIDGIEEAKDHHKAQLNFYLKCLSLERGFILYIDRRDLRSKLFEVRFDEKLFEELVRRAIKLYEHLKANKVPLPEAKTSRDKMWQCAYCPYSDLCWEEDRK